MEKTDNSYIAIDLETTGLNPKTERIIEIGAARVEDGTVVQTYSTFVNPERELDARIRELTGICDDDLKDAPVLDTVLPELGNARSGEEVATITISISSGEMPASAIARFAASVANAEVPSLVETCLAPIPVRSRIQASFVSRNFVKS